MCSILIGICYPGIEYWLQPQMNLFNRKINGPITETVYDDLLEWLIKETNSGG